MMFINPVKDFLLATSKHAKSERLRELNYLEAEVIMAEESLIAMKNQGMSAQLLNSFENKIDDLKQIILNKKRELY